MATLGRLESFWGHFCPFRDPNSQIFFLPSCFFCPDDKKRVHLPTTKKCQMGRALRALKRGPKGRGRTCEQLGQRRGPFFQESTSHRPTTLCVAHWHVWVQAPAIVPRVARLTALLAAKRQAAGPRRGGASAIPSPTLTPSPTLIPTPTRIPIPTAFPIPAHRSVPGPVGFWRSWAHLPPNGAATLSAVMAMEGRTDPSGGLRPPRRPARRRLAAPDGRFPLRFFPRLMAVGPTTAPNGPKLIPTATSLRGTGYRFCSENFCSRRLATVQPPPLGLGQRTNLGS